MRPLEPDAFFLSPKNQDRLIKIMDQLKKDGYPTDNSVMTLVLREMRRQGVLPQVYKDQDILEMVKKVVRPGGKILHIKGDDKNGYV